MGRKREREERGDDEPGPSGRGPASVGQQTSFIKNKLVRSEKYAQLKHKAKVRRAHRAEGSAGDGGRRRGAPPAAPAAAGRRRPPRPAPCPQRLTAPRPRCTPSHRPAESQEGGAQEAAG
jgi:hypothetical protein